MPFKFLLQNTISVMNKKVQLQDLGNKDYKDTWDYQEELFKEIVDFKIQNRREETPNFETPNYFLYRRTSTCLYFRKKWA